MAFIVVALPAAVMLVGSFVAFFGRIPDMVQAATQNFSAGLLIAAVAGELFPLMNGNQKPEGAAEKNIEAPNSILSTIAIAVGFALALAFMFGLEELTEGDEEDEDDKGKSMKSLKSFLVSSKSKSDLETPLNPKSKSDLETPLTSKSKESCGCDNLTIDSETVVQAVAKQAKVMEGTLSSLKTELETGDRDAIDAQVHALKIPVHALKRVLNGHEDALPERDLARMKFHTEELTQNIVDLKAVQSAKEACQRLCAVTGTIKHIHEHAERDHAKFRRWSIAPLPDPEEKLKEDIPWPLVFTVGVDAGVDGLLIGLAYAASAGAGWSMSIATTIEMGFLGLSFSATIQNATSNKGKHAGIVFAPPLALLLTGVLGSFVGALLTEWALVFIAFISFAVVALLFLVTQELLAEAREVAGEDKLITSMFFVGVFGGILLEKFVG
jgi:zinc transporter ZupT